MLTGQDVLIVGAREGGYGASIGRALVISGARVFGTSLDPDSPREQDFFQQAGIMLLSTPLKFDSDRRDQVFESLARIVNELKSFGVSRLEAVVHTVAGGFPRQPSVMKAVGDILKGKHTFSDMATAVRRNVYYVNAGSFLDLADGLKELSDEQTQFAALTYRGDLPYFISDTKAYLEKLAVRMARHEKRSLIAALPEAWTQSSQFFTGIELAVIYHYLTELKPISASIPEIQPLFHSMEMELAALEGFGPLLKQN